MLYLYSCSDGDHRTLYYAENEADITNPEKNSVYRFDITNPSECSFIVCLIADLVLRNRPDEFLHPHDANQSNLNIEVFRKSIADVLDHKIWSDFILSDDFVNLFSEYLINHQSVSSDGIIKYHTYLSAELCYVSCLIILYIYTGKVPAQIWDESFAEFGTKMEIYNAFEDAVSRSVPDAKGKALIMSTFRKSMFDIIEHTIAEHNARLLSIMPNRLASCLSKVLMDSSETYNLNQLWEAVQSPEFNCGIGVNYQKGIVRTAGCCSYVGLKHIVSAAPGEDSCGIYVEEDKGLTLPLCMCVADGVSGASGVIEIDGKKYTTTKFGAECACKALWSVTADLYSECGDFCSYGQVCRYMDQRFKQQIYDNWTKFISEKVSDVEKYSDFTTTLIGLMCFDQWVVLVKIGNGGLVVDTGRGPYSKINLSDNCTDKQITASISKSVEHPEYWNIMILPRAEVRSVLMYTDGADYVMEGKYIPYNGVLVQASRAEHPYYEEFMDLCYNFEDSKDLYAYLDKITGNITVNADYAGSSTGLDDTTIAYMSFKW